MTPAETALRAAAEAAGPGPAFAAEARREGLEALRRGGLPTTSQEDWRFTSLAGLFPHAFAPARADAAVTAQAIDAAAGPAFGPRLVFVNGRFREELSRLPGLPSGVRAASLAGVAAGQGDLLRTHLGRIASPAGRPFAALNGASLADGALVLLPDGVRAPAIELLFATVADGSPVVACPRTLVVAGAGSEAAVVETYVALGGAPVLTSAVTEIVLGDGARLDHYQVQDQPADAFHLATVAARAGRDAHLSSHSTALGATLSRSEVVATLEGPGAEAHLAGLYLADGHRIVDNHSVVEHRAPNGTSRELFKGILDGAARAVFAGRIRVNEGAQKTDSHQLNANLLLSRDAVVDTMPQLEIYADDVKCGHGGTVGELDAEALFYLRSRGIGLARARSLLIYAFAREMVDRIGPPVLRDRIGDRVAAKLPDGAAIREAA